MTPGTHPLVHVPGASPSNLAAKAVVPVAGLVGGPALIWAGFALGSTTKSKIALVGIGAVLMLTSVPQLFRR